MAKVLPIKTKRRSMAAYAASQPLFDALRNGMQSVKDQRANLEIARDTVQRLHVKLPSSSIAADVRDGHETYMDGAVKAWRLATESYAEIFQALADVTAAEASTGRKQRQGHEAFMKMAGSAREAYETAMDWKMTTPRTSIESNLQAGQAADEDEDMEDVSESESADDAQESKTNGKVAAGAREDIKVKPSVSLPDKTPTNPILMSLLNNQPNVRVPSAETKPQDSKGDAEKNDTPNTAPGANATDTGRRHKRFDKRRKRKEKRVLARAQGDKPGNAQKKATTPSASEEPKQAKPMYEDVSAQVAARLAAKDAKPETTKEKKRKRGSRDSLENSAAMVKEEKPTKKRAKSNDGEPVEDATKKEKARKHEREADGARDGVVVEGRKKRKKV